MEAVRSKRNKQTLSGGAALRHGLRAAGLTVNPCLTGDATFKRKVADVKAVLPTTVVIDRGTGQQVRTRPRREEKKKAPSAKRRLNQQTRPLPKVLRLMRSELATRFEATAGSERVCAVVASGRAPSRRVQAAVSSSSGTGCGRDGGKVDKTYLDYSAEVLLLKTEAAGVCVVHAAPGDDVCRTWVGVGAPTASGGDVSRPRAFGEIDKVYLQRGFDDGFDVAAWAAAAADDYEAMRHMTDGRFHQKTHLEEDTHRHEALSTELGYAYPSYNRQLGWVDGPWLLHVNTPSASDERKAAVRAYMDTHLDAVVSRMWKVCKERFPTAAAAMQLHTDGSPFRLSSTPWNKVTVSLNNPTLAHFDHKNGWLTALLAVALPGEKLEGGHHAILSPDLKSAVVVVDDPLGWLIVGDYASVLHANLSTSLGKRFIVNAYCNEDVSGYWV